MIDNQRKPKVLVNQTAAIIGQWKSLGYKNESSPTRTAVAEVTSGDTLTIELKVEDEDGVSATHSYDFTENDARLIDGPWTHMRGVKVGANGAGKLIVLG